MNSNAKIYVQRKAFQPHYSKFLFLKVSVGIDEKYEDHPQIVLVDGGYHLFNPQKKKTVPHTLLDEITKEMIKYSEIQFYTCHCTGTEAYRFLPRIMQNLNYLFCGEEVDV